MRIENGFADGTGFEESKAQDHRIGGNREERRMDIRCYGHLIDQDAVDTHDDHDKEALEAQGQKPSCIVVSDLTPLPVRHGCERNRSHGRIQVNLDHPAVQDNRYQYRDDLHTHGDQRCFQRQCQQFTDTHCFHCRFKLSNGTGYVDGGIRSYHACCRRDHMLPDIEDPHDDIEGVRHQKDRHEALEEPLEEHPSVHLVHVVSFRDHRDQFIAQNEGYDHTGDRDNDRVRQAPDHGEDASVP